MYLYSRNHDFRNLTSLRKQPTFGDATTGFPAKWRLRNERRNSILMTRHYPDLGSASDWLNQISHAARPIRSTAQIWVVTRHQYGISVLVSQTSFGGETSGSVAKCRLFSQARTLPKVAVNLPRNLLDFKEHVVHLILRKYVRSRIHSTTRASVQWTSQVISFLIVLPSILKWLLTVSWSTANGYHD